MRRWTSSGAELPPGEDGVLFRFLNTSKRGVAIDWTTADGRAALLDLVADADVVVESVGGVDWPSVTERNPSTSLVSVSWFGRSGPWRDRPATESTVQAWAGSTATRGTVERPPLVAGGRLGECLAGGYAAIGAVAAVIGARRTGRGQHVDLSVLEAAHLSMAPFTTVIASFGGASAAYGRTVEIPSIEPAADGWVGFCTITNQQWRGFPLARGRGRPGARRDLPHYVPPGPRAGGGVPADPA